MRDGALVKCEIYGEVQVNSHKSERVFNSFQNFKSNKSYLAQTMTEYDPRLVAPTCLYLAAKQKKAQCKRGCLFFTSKNYMHADDFRQNRYGVVSRVRDDGYSDDMTLAAVARILELLEETNICLGAIYNKG